MAVSKTQYGRYTTLTGTLAEVAGALNTEVVPMANVISLAYDSDNSVYFAVYHK